jgi:hypothetical protein
MQSRKRLTTAALVLGGGLFGFVFEAKAYNFWIGEVANFDSDCGGSDVNTVTTSLNTALISAGWTGFRVKDANAWPQDFTESCNSGLYRAGNDVADTSMLAVYAGHGYLEGTTVGISFGTRHSGLCYVNFASSNRSDTGVARLGQMNNARNGFSAWITSCTMDSNHLWDGVNYQWVNQNFGFDNSPAVESNQAKDWFNAIGNRSNKTAWLDEMEDKQGIFTGDNNPIVASYSSTSAGCTDMHNNKRLKAQILTPRSGGPACGGGVPAFVWCATLRSNGDGCS